jgi:hypothetical protein
MPPIASENEDDMETKYSSTQNYLQDVQDGNETLETLKARKSHNEKIAWFIEALSAVNDNDPLKEDYNGLCEAIEILEAQITPNT